MALADFKFGNKTIWIVENDERVREGVESALERTGASVRAFADASSMIMALRNGGQPPHLIVSDDFHTHAHQIIAAMQDMQINVPVVVYSPYDQRDVTGIDFSDPALRAHVEKGHQTELLYRQIESMLQAREARTAMFIKGSLVAGVGDDRLL